MSTRLALLLTVTTTACTAQPDEPELPPPADPAAAHVAPMVPADAFGAFEVGFERATPAQQRRLFEAATGVDVDYAVATAKALRAAAAAGSACPTAVAQPDGSLLISACRGDGRALDGSLVIADFVVDGRVLSTAYAFTGFDVRADGKHDHFDGAVDAVEQHLPTGFYARLRTRGLTEARTWDAADAIATTSTGTWIRTVPDHVKAMRLELDSSSGPIRDYAAVAIAGVGTYTVASDIDLATMGGTFRLDAPTPITATSAGGGACWTFANASIAPICDALGFDELDH